MVRQVFVYGTLKRGFPRYSAFGLNTLRKRVESATTAGSLHDLGDYPGLVLDAKGRVEGEIHLFSDINKALRIMDTIEGYLGEGRPGSLFERVIIEARDSRGRRRRCWAYVYARSTAGYPRIASGSWEKLRNW